MLNGIMNILIAILFTGYGLFLRYQCLLGRQLWNDELNQLRNTVGKFFPIWHRLTNGEMTCFPGEYLITYPFVQWFPTNKWGLAIPHILATLLGYYFLYLICRKYLKTSAAFIIVFFLVTFNQWLIYHSFEFRPYAVLPTLALGCFYLAGRIVDDYAQLTYWNKFGIWFFFVFTVFYHPYGLLILGLCLAFFMLARFSGNSLGKTFLQLRHFLLLLAVVALPMFGWYASGTSQIVYGHLNLHIHTFDYIPNPIDHFDSFWRSVANFLLGSKKYGAKFLPLVIGLALLVPTQNRGRYWLFLLILIIFPIEFILLSDVTREYWFIQRQFVWVMPWYAFLIGWAWDGLILKWWKRK